MGSTPIPLAGNLWLSRSPFFSLSKTFQSKANPFISLWARPVMLPPPILRSGTCHRASFLPRQPTGPTRGWALHPGETNCSPIVQNRAKRWLPRGVAERLVRPGPCVLCALWALCVCVVRPTPFLPPLQPWRPWLVWLRVRPRLRERHVGLAGLASAQLARGGARQRPAGAGLAGGRSGPAPPPGPARCGRRRPRPEAEGETRALGGRGSGSGPLPGAGEELERRGCSPWSPAGVEQPGSGPGYLGGGRGMRRGPATFGSRASGQPAVRTRGRVGVSTESGLAGLFSERGLVLRTPVACPEEVSSSGRSCTDPFWCRAKARFHSLLAWLGRVAPSCHSACRLLSSRVTWRKFSCPLLGHPCEHFRFTFLPGWAFNACMHLYAFGLKPHGSYQAYCGQVFYVLIEYSRGLDLKAVLLIVTRKRSLKKKKKQ